MTQEKVKKVRNKVLIVDANPKEKEELESILQSVVEEGGELFFAEKKEEALYIIKNEHPQLVFLDFELMGESDDWVFDRVHVIVMREKHMAAQISSDFIFKPFRRHQILEKCRELLGHEPFLPIPPM